MIALSAYVLASALSLCVYGLSAVLFFVAVRGPRRDLWFGCVVLALGISGLVLSYQKPWIKPGIKMPIVYAEVSQ